MSFEELRSVVEVPEAGDAPLIMAAPAVPRLRSRHSQQLSGSFFAGGLKVFRAGIWKPRTKPVVLKE